MALGRQLTGRLENQIAQLADCRLLQLPCTDPLLQDWKQVGGRLARTRDGMCQDVIAFKNSRDRLPLDNCWVLELQVLGRLGKWF